LLALSSNNTDQPQLQPLQNQTISSQTRTLSNIDNKTMGQTYVNRIR